MAVIDDGVVESLARRASRGDADAFSELVRRTTHLVFSTAARILGDAAAAEDVAQETFFRAWKKLPALENPAAFCGWIRMMAVRLAIDAIRKGRKIVLFAEGPPDRTAPDNPERTAIESERRKWISEELARLDAEYAETVVLVDLEGLTYEEAAGVLGIGIDNLKVRLHRARRMLRDRFMERGLFRAEDA